MNVPTQIIDTARHCAGLFRLGRDIEAALEMVELIETAMPLFTSRSVQEQAQWMQVLSAVLQCQERQDWLGVADWLEVEFVEMWHWQ
ncbi:hypothetical protein [Pseudomonas sp. LP_7_YM]|uniref:hypothetical protein n=1 Tax=Pseudomonas sp. LP_7_YM TaxID=2485137 RepID=UPI00105C60A9|nr:hypothetical protein [Pseudomonas sp. LP_7_YM]TDV67998.1 hypothetical protein EC915_103536 [Pseudomonas sp. LP_7_YM]